MQYCMPNTKFIRKKVCHGHDRIIVGFITTYAINGYDHKVVSSNPAHGEVYKFMW